MERTLIRGDRVGRTPPPSRTYAAGRACKAGCGTRLSIYNPGDFCWRHAPLSVPVNAAPPRRAKAA